MITFLVSMALLVLGYMVYGRFVERVFGPDDRVTPAVSKADGLYSHGAYILMKETAQKHINKHIM